MTGVCKLRSTVSARSGESTVATMDEFMTDLNRRRFWWAGRLWTTVILGFGLLLYTTHNIITMNRAVIECQSKGLD